MCNLLRHMRQLEAGQNTFMDRLSISPQVTRNWKPTTAAPLVPQNLKMLLLKQQTQAVNDRISAKGCRYLLVKPWANGTGKGNTCQLCGAIISDKGEITGTSKAIQRRLMTEDASLQPDGGDPQNWTWCRIDEIAG